MKFRNVRAAALAAGVKPITVYMRIYRLGLSLEEALVWGQKPQEEKYLRKDGKPNLAAWARKSGIPLPTLRARIAAGLSLEEALALGKAKERKYRDSVKIKEAAQLSGLSESGIRKRMLKFGISADAAAALGDKIKNGRSNGIVVLDLTHLRPRPSK